MQRLMLTTARRIILACLELLIRSVYLPGTALYEGVPQVFLHVGPTKCETSEKGKVEKKRLNCLRTGESAGFARVKQGRTRDALGRTSRSRDGGIWAPCIGLFLH